MYQISVRGPAGAGALAERLADAGYDVTSRTATEVHVIGSATVATRLGRLPGVTVVGRVPAAPTGPIPAAPASQNPILPKKLQGKKYPTYYGGYRTVKGYQEFEADLQKAYPNLVKEVQYGTSFTGKEPLNVLCVTLDPSKGCALKPTTDKPRFLLETQIHAREIATSEMAWRFLTDLVDGYGSDAQITALLQSSEIWIAPQVNPDGVDLVQQGIAKDGTSEDSSAWQRKNNDEQQTPKGGCPGDWADSQPGVDLNRNWSVHWGGASTSRNPCSEVFLGKAAMSETETQALAKLTQELFKDQRGKGPKAAAPLTTTGEMLTMHTDGGVNLIPWDFSSAVQAPNDTGLRTLGFRQSYYTGLPTGQSGQVLYDVGGGTDDWAYAKLGIASATWELADTSADCSGFFPDYSCMDGFAATYLPGLVYTAGAARMPYKLSLGPTVLSATAKAAGSSVTVTAKADDDAFGASGFGRPTAQPVTAARIYVGTAPWDGGQAVAMKIQGKGTSEVLAYVQAKNASGDWGPAEAVWIPAAS
jgi:carboxypeptidase T